MAGRGRGRGRGALNFDAITKTVGVSSAETASPLSDLTDKINTLDINAPSVNAVTQCAIKAIKDGDSMEEKVLDVLISRCHKDWHFAKQAAVISRELVSDAENGKKFRAQLLRTLQSNFKQKDIMRDEASRFLGAMSFMAQTFAVMRSDSGEPFTPLITPVVDVLQGMTEDNATDQEMECGVTQIRAIIPTIYLCNPSHLDKYHSLLSTLRADVIDCRGTRELRESMLSAIEDDVRHAARRTV